MSGIFWGGLAVVFYTYLDYGLVLWALTRGRMSNTEYRISNTEIPNLAFVCCAWNEQDYIEQKIANSLALDYPPDKIHFWFVTDGSTDASPERVRRYPFPAGVGYTLLHQPERRGKIAAFQRAMALIDAPVVVSTDANTSLNPEALRRMLRHFKDPQTGTVAG